MNDYTPAIGMTINSLAAFASSVIKSILFECPDKFSDGSIFELMDHNETAIAGSSKTSILSDGDGISSPASIRSSI